MTLDALMSRMAKETPQAITESDYAGYLRSLDNLSASGLSHKFLTLGPRQSPGIEIVGEGGSIEAIHPPSPTTQSRELSRGSKWQEFTGKTTSTAYKMNTGALQPAVRRVHELGIRFITRGPERNIRDIASLNRLVKQIGGIEGYIPIPRNLEAAELCDNTPNAEAASVIAMIEQALAEKQAEAGQQPSEAAPMAESAADDSWTYWGYFKEVVVHVATATANTAVSVATNVTPTWAKEMAALKTAELEELLASLRAKANLHKASVIDQKE